MANKPEIGSGLLFLSDDAEEREDDTIANGDADGYYAESDADEDADEYIPYENPQTGQKSRKRLHSPTPQGAQGAKKARYEGTAKHATAIRIKINKDIDERIYDLKQAGYADQYIATKLEEDQRCKFSAKTVSSRYLKFRTKKDQEADEKLDDELSDWHVNEDDHLRESCNAVEKKFEIEIQKLQEKKWKAISVHLTERLGERKYTANACKERFEGLLDGTALIPIELDPDQEGRKLKRETRIREAKRARAEYFESIRRAEEEKGRKEQEEKDRKARNKRERDEQKKAKEAAKAEDKRIKEERQAGKVLERAAREAAQERARQEVEEKRQIAEAEDLVYRYYEGKSIKKHKPKKTRKDDGYGDDDDDGLDDDDWDSEEEDFEDDFSDLEDDDEDDASAEDTDEPSCDLIEEKAPRTIFRTAQVTEKTLLNPRSVMSNSELEVLLFERDLPRRGVTETHPQIVARLAAADGALNNITLNNLLKKHFVGTKGNMEVRIHRLQQCDADASAAGQNGFKSTDPNFKASYEGYGGEYDGLTDDE